MTTAALNTPKDFALYYLHKLDLSVFVLKSSPAKERKQPAVPSTDPYFERKCTDEEIDKWFTIDPDYNLAIPLGAVTQAVAFDVDGADAVERIKSKIPQMSNILREAFANTMKNKTGGGGEHIIFKVEGDISDLTKEQLWANGKRHSQVLMVANRSYIAAAPSLHPNGLRYQWNGKEPVTVTRQEVNEFIRLVGSARRAEKSHNTCTSTTADAAREEGTRVLSPEEMQELLSWVKPYYTPGNRDHIIFYLSGMMRKEGFSLESAKQFVTLLYESSEYDDEDLEKSLAVVEHTCSKSLDQISGKKGLHNLLVTSFETSYEYDSEQYEQRREAFSQICQVINGKPAAASSEATTAPQDEGGGEGKEEDDDKKRTTRAKRALELALAHSQELFLNEFGRAFAAMKMSDGHVEVHPMDESRFKNWIAGIYYSTYDELLNDDDLKRIGRILTSRADFDSNIPRRSLDLRVRGYNEAEYHHQHSSSSIDDDDDNGVGDVGDVSSFGELVEDFDAIYYDLTNKKWEAIKITPEGWEVDKHPPFLFRRYGGEVPQVRPDRNYEPGILSNFVKLLNAKPEYVETQEIVLEVKIVTDFWPNTTPKPILVLHSSHGSGKTTGFELMRDLVDPNSTLTMSMSRDEAQLKQDLAHNYMSFFDNVSNITDEQSNILCRGVTGAGDRKRKLYENDEDIVYHYRRIEGVNGITNIVTKSDLLDRGLAVEFAEIPKEKRELLRKIYKTHLELKPKVLAFCLDVISQVMAERKKWKGIDEYYFGLKGVIEANGGLPRMADWAILGEQVAAVIARKEGKPYKPGEFLQAFDKNLEMLNTEALKSSLVAEALIAFIANREVVKGNTEWEGSATMLLADLNHFIIANAESVKINIRAKAWPQDPTALGKELATIKPNLAPLGIKIESTRTKKNVLHKITKAPTPTYTPTPKPNSRSNLGEFGVGGSPDSPPTPAPTLKEAENHAQNQSGVGGVGGVGQMPKLGGADLQGIISKATRDQDYFTQDSWVFTCLLWPNLQMTAKQAEQLLNQLLQQGKVKELEPGKYSLNSGGAQ